MAITFKSKASGDVTLLDANAREILELIGKTVGERGVITAADAAACAKTLRAATTQPAAQQTEEEDDTPGGGVSLKLRAVPFIELLEKSAAAGADILWGV